MRQSAEGRRNRQGDIVNAPQTECGVFRLADAAKRVLGSQRRGERDSEHFRLTSKASDTSRNLVRDTVDKKKQQLEWRTELYEIGPSISLPACSLVLTGC